MKAFVDTPITKEQFLKHIYWHRDQDAFVKGSYSKNDEGKFKGCAVGCSIHSIQMELGLNSVDYGNHALYEKYLGIPEWLARVEDNIFEGLPNKRSAKWPIEFIESINTGANLDKIKPAFLVFVLESNLDRLQNPKFKEQKNAVERCISLWKSSDIGSVQWETERSVAWAAARAAARSTARAAARSTARSAAESAARSAAESAAWSAAESAAWSAAESAARSTAWSAAESAAESAAWSAAWSAARSTAWSAAEPAAWSAAESAACSAACSAAWSAARAAARSTACSAAWSTAYTKFADKLLELIRTG